MKQKILEMQDLLLRGVKFFAFRYYPKNIFSCYSSLFTEKALPLSYLELFKLMKHVTITMLTAMFALCLSAQNPLSSTNNAMRAGDVLYKMKVEYMNVGGAGINQTWVLGNIEESSKDIVQGIVTKGDTVTILEKGNICHYIFPVPSRL